MLLPGFKRTGHHGVLANCHKCQQAARCCAALDVATSKPDVSETVNAFMRRVADTDRTANERYSMGN